MLCFFLLASRRCVLNRLIVSGREPQYRLMNAARSGVKEKSGVTALENIPHGCITGWPIGRIAQDVHIRRLADGVFNVALNGCIALTGSGQAGDFELLGLIQLARRSCW
jgi:hypothetical protein